MTAEAIKPCPCACACGAPIGIERTRCAPCENEDHGWYREHTGREAADPANAHLIRALRESPPSAERDAHERVLRREASGQPVHLAPREGAFTPCGRSIATLTSGGPGLPFPLAIYLADVTCRECIETVLTKEETMPEPVPDPRHDVRHLVEIAHGPARSVLRGTMEELTKMWADEEDPSTMGNMEALVECLEVATGAARVVRALRTVHDALGGDLRERPGP